MKTVLGILLISLTAQAIPRGEWQEMNQERSLLIKKKTFLFRGCGRYFVIKNEDQTITLFTGRDAVGDSCLDRGSHLCSFEMNGETQMTLDCGVWKRKYKKEKKA